MLKAPIPVNEQDRHKDLLSYRILDTAEEEDYNQLTELAAMFCDCEMAAISFIDTNRQWFKATVNLPDKEGPRDISFCGHAIIYPDIMVVNDAQHDERFFDNPDVAGGLGVGFYAGAPIISSSGHKLGTVCVIDHQPKKVFDPKQEQALKTIASQVRKLLELRIKNVLIKKQSEELVKAEKNIAKLNTLMREKRNDEIAYELHENIAQLVVAAKMNVELLEKDHRSDETERVKNYLSIILNDVRTLSQSITPTTFTAANYCNYICDLAERITAEGKAKVFYSQLPENIRLQAPAGLIVYRIVQGMIAYALAAKAGEIQVELVAEEKIQLLFLHNGTEDIIGSDEAKVYINNITTRADIINAVFTSDPTHNKMELSFQITQ